MRGAATTSESEVQPQGGPERGALGARIGGGLFLALIAAILVAFGIGLLRRGNEVGSFGGFGVNAIGGARQWAPRSLPSGSIRLYDGGNLQLQDLQGSMSVINFWASWCVPCRTEAPVFARASRDPANRGVRFVGINEWDTDEDAMRFLSEFDITYANGPDQGGRIAIELGMKGIPETYVANSAGLIVARWMGPLNDDELNSLIGQARSKNAEAAAG